MCQTLTVEVLKIAPSGMPQGEDRVSREVNLKTKQMSWNRPRTSTNRRSKTVNLVNKSAEGGTGGRERARRQKTAKKHPFWKLLHLKKKKKSSPKLFSNSKENKGGCTAADQK